MTAAAFQATYSDWRLIKGRKVVQVVFELPLEGADAAYNALGGMPNPAAEVWCAIARLEERKVIEPRPASELTPSPPTRARKSWHDMTPAQQAGILCNDAKFQLFAAEQLSVGMLTQEETENFVRNSCCVQSRSEIKPGTNTAALWDALVSRFRAWEKAPEVGAA